MHKCSRPLQELMNELECNFLVTIHLHKEKLELKGFWCFCVDTENILMYLCQLILNLGREQLIPLMKFRGGVQGIKYDRYNNF